MGLIWSFICRSKEEAQTDGEKKAETNGKVKSVESAESGLGSSPPHSPLVKPDDRMPSFVSPSKTRPQQVITVE